MMIIGNENSRKMNMMMNKIKYNSSSKSTKPVISDIGPLLSAQETQLNANVADLLRWVTAGENEVYLRQMIDATLSESQTGYSIAHFDFLIYFKHMDVRARGSEEPLKYLRRLILAEFCVKVKTNLTYLNFHKRHDAMIKLWQQMVRVISFESSVSLKEKDEEVMLATSDDEGSDDEKRKAIDMYKQKRIAIIRNYMVYCQNNQQSKTQQCSDLRNIFISLWNIETALEAVEGGDVGDLSLLAFTRLWNTRYNTQNRIVINASDEQLEARAMFCHSANALLQYFNYFQKSPLNTRSIGGLVDQLQHFIQTNNNANNYNVNVQSLSNEFSAVSFGFCKSSFCTEILPLLRTAMEGLSRVSQLQSNIYLSLYESFWDVSFVITFFNHLVNMIEANNFGAAEASPLVEMALTANNKKKIRKLENKDTKKTKKFLKRIKRLIE